uniref:Uncharacterized protein n=1 Tax=Phlebotomus papatasi TaxID=29031 RepID=A0A1B0DLI5_PHLPP
MGRRFSRQCVEHIAQSILKDGGEDKGRLSIGGDPFEKMLSQARLHNDPFECLSRSKLSSVSSLTNNVGDLEDFFQGSPILITPNSNSAFVFCDISPIVNSSNSDQSVLNNAFVQTSSVVSGKTASNSDEIIPRKRFGSEPVVRESEGKEKPNKTVHGEMIPEKALESPDIVLWQSIVDDVKEDLTTEMPPPMFSETDEDSLENLKIPILEQLSMAEKQSGQKEDTSSSPEIPSVTSSVFETSAIVEDLRRRMKDVLNKRIHSEDLNTTDKSLNAKGLIRQETFEIDKKPKDAMENQKKAAEDSSEDTFMEKLKMMCGEHNVSVVQDASKMNDSQSRIVVLVNQDSTKPGTPLKRRNSFCSEIPRPTDSPTARRRRSVTVAPPKTDLLTPREWKCPVGKVLPSPQFRGQQLKIRAAEPKIRGSVGPMRALRPTPKIQVDENVTPPERGPIRKRRSLVTTSTPKVDSSKPLGTSTPLVKFPDKASHKRLSCGPKHLTENNRIQPRFTPSK